MWNMKVMIMPIAFGAPETVSKDLRKKTRRSGNQRKNEDNLDHNIVKISQNTEKSPGDLKRLDVIQTLVKEVVSTGLIRRLPKPSKL